MKTMQKRLALALAAVLMMALLTGCASGASAASPTATAELTAQPTAEATPEATEAPEAALDPDWIVLADQGMFSAGGTSALLSQVSGLDDFELICFLVVREEPSC